MRIVWLENEIGKKVCESRGQKIRWEKTSANSVVRKSDINKNMIIMWLENQIGKEI